MNITYIRSSSYNTYEDCEFRYFLQYILNLPDKGGPASLKGTIVHHVLELLARGSKCGHNKDGKLMDPERLLEICWDRYTREEQKINLVKKDYDFCWDTTLKVLGSAYHPYNLKVLDIEKQFVIPLGGDGFQYNLLDPITGDIAQDQLCMRGTMDLITEVDDSTIEIIDWKTGKRKDWKTGNEKCYDFLKNEDIQVRMYDLATSLLYPQYPNRMVTVYFINDGGPHTVVLDDNDRKETVEILRDHFKSVSENFHPTRIKEEKPNQSWKCNRVCAYGKTKSKNGVSICDNIHSYLSHNGISQTMVKISEMTVNGKEQSKTSDRRNVYK